MRAIALCLVAILGIWNPARALEWFYIVPNPAYSRDLSMGTSTMALRSAPQSASINPAGFTAFPRDTELGLTVSLNPGGLWSLSNYVDREWPERETWDRITESTRLLVHSVVAQFKVATLAVVLGEPVMLRTDTARYRDFEERSPLSQHQNGLLFALNLHPRISMAGRIDRYYRDSDPEGEGYSYGVIVRPRGLQIGVQYQRFPASGARAWHFLDRREDEAVTAGFGVIRRDWMVTAQLMNLSQTTDSLELEPRVGGEWRPWRGVAFRAGAAAYADGEHWAWTTGIGLLDANWFRARPARLPAADDVLQAAAAVIYHHRRPVLAFGSLTLAWRL